MTHNVGAPAGRKGGRLGRFYSCGRGRLGWGYGKSQVDASAFITNTLPSLPPSLPPSTTNFGRCVSHPLKE